MAEDDTLADNFKITLEGRGGPIVYPEETFSIKMSLLNLLKEQCQFHGIPGDDPILHIYRFIAQTDCLRNGTEARMVNLYLFPFTLFHHAKSWFENLDPKSIHTWSELYDKFLNHFFPIPLQIR